MRAASAALRVPARALAQRTSFTHPQLIAADCVAPGLSLAELCQRRDRLLDKLPEGSAVLLLGSRAPLMAHDIPYRFRQDTDFWYLTGVEEESCAAVLRRAGGETRFSLFVRERDPSHELWTGPTVGVRDAAEAYGASEAHALTDLAAFLAKAMPPGCRLHTLGSASALALQDALTAAGAPQPLAEAMKRFALADASVAMQQLRSVKSPAELQLMRKAAAITATAFASARACLKPGLCENVLDASLEYHMRLQGARRHAYPPVIAGGNRANTLHYIANDATLRAGELVLLDAGAEFEYYASDVSRTWAVSGVLTEPQAVLYDAVLAAQQAAVRLVAPGISLHEIGTQARAHLGASLARAGVLRSASDRHLDVLFPHSIGHLLGIDVHDTPLISPRQPLVPGNVVTIEPGLYLAADDDRVPAAYRGIGIRIEDNCVVSGGGPCEVLTAAVPK